jgi:hypothetical protein
MDLNTGIITVSLNHTLPLSLNYSTHEVFTSHLKSSQDDSQLTNWLELELTWTWTNVNCGIITATIILSYSTDNCSHKSSIHTFRSSSTTNLQQLPPTENSLKLNAISPINPRSDTRKNTVSYNCWRHMLQCDITAEMRRSRDPSPLLHNPSVFSCCTVQLGTAQQSSAQHGENNASIVA